MELTREQVIKIYNVFGVLRSKKCNVKFAYFIAKNKKKLQSEIDTLNEVFAPSDEFKKYESLRYELLQKYCKRNETGGPIIKDNNYVINEENQYQFNEEIEKLKLQYKECIEENINKTEHYKQMLKEKVEYDLYKINIEYILEDIEPSIIELFLDAELLIE